MTRIRITAAMHDIMMTDESFMTFMFANFSVGWCWVHSVAGTGRGERWIEFADASEALYFKLLMS